MINILNLALIINQNSANRGISIFILLIGLAITIIYIYEYSKRRTKFINQILKKYKNFVETEMNIIHNLLKKQTIGMFVMVAVLFGIFGIMWIITIFTYIDPEEILVIPSIVITSICVGLSIMMTMVFSSDEGYSEKVLEAKLTYFKENKKYRKIVKIVALLGNIYVPKKELERAIQCWKDAKEAYTQLKRKDKVIKINIMISLAYFEINKKDGAAEFLNDARRIATEIGDLNTLAICEKLERERKQ